MCRDVKSDNCLLKVALPPERDRDKSKNVLAGKQSNNEYIHSAGQKRTTFPDDTGQEWLFTLCHEHDSGNKEDMSTFIHGVRKAIDASLRPASHSTTAFKIKIVLSSSDDQQKVPHTEKKHSPSEETGRPVRRLYCAGENIERRNHYLDLAGIENFTSKFDNEESTAPEPLSPHQHHPVVTSDNCTQPGTYPSFSVLNYRKTKPIWKEEKSSRLQGQHQCPPSHFKHTVNVPVHRSHSKRLRPQDHTSPRRPVCCYGHVGSDSDVLSHLQLPSCSPLVRHHHLHEHHHYHHHHYHAA